VCSGPDDLLIKATHLQLLTYFCWPKVFYWHNLCLFTVCFCTR
jgi:hypothetical protein